MGRERTKSLRQRENEGQKRETEPCTTMKDGLYKLKSISVGKVKKLFAHPLNSKHVYCWLVVELFSF